MFYSQFILAKKGPLGTIWIAAHLERKLRKNQVADTDIGVSVDSILSPDVPIALRLSSHLLLGVVRIYSRKVNYLFHDCSEALLKVKQAFRSTAVDLPPEESTAPYHSITLPETFDLDDFELPDSDTFQGNFVDHHVSTREQITLQDSMDGVVYSTSQFGLDERFGDGDTSQIGLDLDEELMLDKVAASGQTAALLDPDNLDPEASGQPMTPYMEMDIDDDDITGEESPVVMLGPKDANTDANAQNETVVNNPALCGNQIQSLNFDGHGLPIELFPSTDPSPQSTQQAPYTPGLVEEAYPTTIHFSEDTTHGPVNKTSLFNSEEVISNPLYEAESHAPKFVAEEIIQNNTSEESFHNRGTNEAGDSISVNNKNSETDVSHLPQDVEKINIADTNSIPSDVGHKVSSPTSVLAEQLKPTSPSSGILDRAPALPDITDKTQKNEHISSENPSSSDVGPIHAEVFPEAGMTENAAPTSVLMETSNEPLQSNEGVSVNPTLTDVSQTIKEDMLEHVCVSQMAFPGPHNSGDLTECTRHDVNPPLVSEATHHFDKEESRGCLGPEVREMQPSVGPDEVISEPRLGLRPCSSVLKQPDTVVLADRNVALNATDLSLTEADLQSSSVLGNVDPDNANGISGPVQGVDFQPTSTRDTFLVSNLVSESVRSNGQEAGFSTVDRAIYTGSRDQLGNLNFTAGFDLAVPQPERLFSAPEAVPLGVSTVDGTLHTVSSKDQLGNLNFAAGFDLPVPQTERLFSAPEAVPFGASSVDGALHAASSKDQLGNLNFTAGFDLTVPQTERLFSAPETVPFGASSVDRASYTVNSKDQLGNLNFRAGFDLAVPQTERMLSAPEAVPFGGGYFPVQSTHGKNVSREREVREIEFNTLTGKKRQQMETTPVEQYSSSELPWMLSNKAFGSIPDDYDVLSSILVGRKSSALKLKPTPQQPDTSKKRQRMTPRTSVAKRKVLMDDTMVLHGDTIRLQLTSTEDIRRVRKKAPCTRPEIWMIQKHLLEDDIFVEPLFTGMSPDLIGVHNRTHNAVIDVRVSEKSVNNMLPEVPKDVLIQKNTDFSGKASREDTVEPVPIEDGAAVNGPMQTHIQIDNQSSEMAVSNLLPEIPEKVLIQKNTDFSGKANREETVEPVPVDDGGAIHEPMQTHKNTDFSGKANREERVEPVSVDDGGAIHEPMKTHIQIANRFSDEHLHPTELDTQEQTRPHSDPAPADLQNGQLDINVSMEIDIGSGDVVGEYPLVAGTMSENRCDETVDFENESLPVDGGNGVDIVEQNGGDLDIQSIENDVAFMEKNNCRADYTVHTANANEEGIPSAHDVLMENGGPAQEIFESDTLKGLEQNIEADHHFDVCNGCSPHIDIRQGNCLRDDKADVPSDAFPPMTNDKPLSSNISVGSEGSTDPTIVINDAKEGIRSDTELIVGENASERIRDDAHNSPSGLVPLEELSCPPSELNLARESDTYIEGENVGMQEAALEGSVDARNMSSQVASLAMRIGDEPTLVDNASKSNDLEDELYENDTEFLNFDDDDDDGAAIEEEDNNIPEAEEADEAGTLDNSGWSSRTRGVAKYLQTLFDAERGRGRKNLSMDNLLSGKTRKEASRMFFETLVLTTRDYVLVEQQNPFGNINIKPRGKLMKSEF